MIDKQDILDVYPDEEFVFATGFDKCILGVSQDMCIVYSVKKVIRILMKDMSRAAAYEHFGFNIEGAYVGEKTPIWCHDDMYI